MCKGARQCTNIHGASAGHRTSLTHNTVCVPPFCTSAPVHASLRHDYLSLLPITPATRDAAAPEDWEWFTVLPARPSSVLVPHVLWGRAGTERMPRTKETASATAAASAATTKSRCQTEEHISAGEGGGERPMSRHSGEGAGELRGQGGRLRGRAGAAGLSAAVLVLLLAAAGIL